jgi:hypothetical protein
MLDIHPAHHAATTWRDFLIHLATIVLGLLIAIGLEQTAEYFHHLHQRHQLEADLRAEGLNNQATQPAVFRYLELEESLALDHLAAVNAMRDGHLKTMPAMPPTYAARSAEVSRLTYNTPDRAVWRAAQQSQVLALLPPLEGERYETIYRRADLVYDYSVARTAAYNEVRALNIKFSSRSTPGTLDAGRMDASQLDVYATRLAQLAQSIVILRSWYAIFYRDNEAMLNGKPLQLTQTTGIGPSSLPFGVVPEDQPKPAVP